ncbi:23S rRNA (uracil(1939)-C(5))-methyltransferase RlmD [Salisaeta longa]|uniref:23S rRNA (uracil(1939)-C(5))-methyltransferase RlmD n=1 Tax=Salisaeta longa TaxID=503170 RepID=UPI0003B677F0|nr:23S rRNA (uracil(1939)-C(5))-methyltransferase RlmD [Salisaeta longa]
MASIDRGDLITLDIEKFADKGKSLARRDGYVVFVEDAVPGDRVKAYVYRAKKNYAEATIDTVIAPSDLRTTPRCRYADTCGGCQWQHVDYAAQCEAKQQSVAEAFQYQSDFDAVDVRPIIGADTTFRYRNRMDFDFSADRWLTRDEIDSGQDFDTDFALGLHVPGNFRKVIDLQECHLPNEVTERLLNGIREVVKARGWSVRDHGANTGFLRQLIVRTGTHTGDVMVHLVTAGGAPERIATLGDILQDKFPEVTTFVHTVHAGRGPTPPHTADVVFGPGVIRERIGGLDCRISPHAFFQPNTRQAERLYDVVREAAALQSTDVLYDLYCGAGTIGLSMADAVEQVVGIERNTPAVEDARANAAANAIANATFVAGDARDHVTDALVDAQGAPDVLVVDPPRPGLHNDVTARIAALAPERFVYVSCNPQTQVRDLDRLHDAYAIEWVQPVDMFPHTVHIETVAALRRR